MRLCEICGQHHEDTTAACPNGPPSIVSVSPPCLNCGGYHNYTINNECPTLCESKQVTGPTLWPFKCPVCDGTGKVSRPPGVAGDIDSWSSSETGPYDCRACWGNAIIWGPPQPPPFIFVPGSTIPEGE